MSESPQPDATQPEQIETRVECRFPDFLCIGAQKAGTTWLDSNLRRHPGVWLPPLKELHYFNSVHIKGHLKWTVKHRRNHGQTLLRRYMQKTAPSDYDYRLIARLADIVDGDLSDHWYCRIFALAPEGSVCGEICPDYCLLPPRGIEHVLRLSPDIKIILSLRDPIARSWSHLRMMMKARGLQGDMAALERMTGAAEFERRADYPAIIDKWRGFIPADRFLTVFMDDIAETPNLLLERVCGFLNVSYEARYFQGAEKSVHVGEAHDIPPRIERLLKKQFAPIYERLADMFPEHGKRWKDSHYSSARV